MNMAAAAAEAAGEEMAVNPGFFSLPLGLFREEANEHLRTRISSCQRKLHSGAVIMDIAVLNLLGMLYYSVRQLGNALGALEEALYRSPESLNTLENIRHTYQLLGRHRDAREVQERLTSLLPQPLARARCLAEQAYAITFGQVEGECLPRLRLSARYFRAALHAGAGSHDEAANWNLCFCVNMLKIADNLYTEQKPRETEFLECLEACLEAYKLTRQGNASLHAMALRTLVTLSSKTSGVNENHINTLLHRYGAKYYYDNSDRCYDEAMKIDPYTPDNYTRYARKLIRDYFKSKQKPTLDRAMFLLDTFIAQHAFTLPARVPEDNPLCNLWFPLVTRGRIRLQLYRKKICRNVGILRQAYADLSNSMKIQRTTESLTDLGEVCHLIAMHDPRHRDFKWYMNAALVHFMDATLCLDGDSKSYIHLKYAACLADYREPRAAAESYKRAAELATIPWQFKESLKGLSRCLMEMYEEDPQRENPLAELAFWLDYTLTATSTANVGNILKQMFDEHRSPMEIVLHQLARQKKRRTLEICLEYLDTDERTALLDLCEQASIDDDEDCPDLDIVTESMINLSLSTSPRQSFVTSTPNKSAPEAFDSGFESNITNQSGMSSVGVTPVLSMEESVCQTQPSAVQSQPSASQSQPSASQPQPSASQPQPSASQPQPSTSQPQPSASQPQPSTSQPQPSTSQPQPSTSQPQPSASQPQPSASQPQPSASQPQPSASQPQPSTSQPQPSTSQPQPSTSQPQPSTSQPQPSTSQPQPSASQPQPSASQPQPSTSQPQPSTSQPQPSISQPQPAASQPQPSISPPQPSASPPQPSASPPQPLDPPQPSPSGVQVRRSLSKPNPSEFLPSPNAPAPSAVPSSAPAQEAHATAQEATTQATATAQAQEATAQTQETQTTAKEAQATTPAQTTTQKAQATAQAQEAQDAQAQSTAKTAAAQATTPAQTTAQEAQATAKKAAAQAAASAKVRAHNELLLSIPPEVPHAKNQHGKTYDFFVSFSTKDAQWVYHTLLPYMEINLKFKGCVADRDFELGKPVLDNIIDGFKRSVCTLLILSPHFLASAICKYELDQVLTRAIERNHKLLPIKLSPCDIPPKLQCYTFLDATHAINFDRLVLNLERHCTGNLATD